MAARKQSIIQRDFSLMETREDLLEAADLEVRARSLRGTTNMRSLETRVLAGRPGSFSLADIPNARKGFEFQPTPSEVFYVVIFDDAVRVYDQAATVEFEQIAVDWNDAEKVWFSTDGPIIVFGHPDFGIYQMEYLDGSWAFGDFTFETSANGLSRNAFWSYNPGTAIQPSARSGSITVTASADVFEAGHVGEIVRYAGWDIEITAVTSGQVATGTVVGNLPPSFTIVLGDTNDIEIGDVAIGQLSGWKGIVTSVVDATTIRAVTTDIFDGPDVSESMSFPSTTKEVVSRTAATPQPSTFWDEPLMSAVHGWAGSGKFIKGRLILVNFIDAPNAIAASTLRSIKAFETGVNDDDAIVRSFGSRSSRLLHVVDSGDLLLFSTNGCYVVSLRDNVALSPTSFNPILFDNRGCSEVEPAVVDDGVVFVEKNSATISAAVLDGNIYLKWSVRQLSVLHNHQISNPVVICGPSLTSTEPEKYLFVVNADGTMAAMSWSGKFGESAVGFSPWVTKGKYLFISSAFGEYWGIVERPLHDGNRHMLERFDYNALVDCAVNATPGEAGAAIHLRDQEVAVAWRDQYAGTYLVNADGSIDGTEDITSAAQIGFNFEAIAQVWPVENIESPRVGTIAVRAYTFMASVQSTGPFQMRCNNFTREVGGYAFGDDLSEAAALKTKVFRAPVSGRVDHNDMAIIKHIPSRIRILYLGQEVQV